MMLGTKAPAETGKLVMLVSGDPAVIERLTPVFDAISIRTVNAGPTSARPPRSKLAANAWVQSVTAAVGQSMALTKALGLDPQLFLDAIKGGATDTPYAQIKGAAIIANDSRTVIRDRRRDQGSRRDPGGRSAGRRLRRRAWQQWRRNSPKPAGRGSVRAGHGAVYTAFLPPDAAE